MPPFWRTCRLGAYDEPALPEMVDVGVEDVAQALSDATAHLAESLAGDVETDDLWSRDLQGSWDAEMRRRPAIEADLVSELLESIPPDPHGEVEEEGDG